MPPFRGTRKTKNSQIALNTPVVLQLNCFLPDGFPAGPATGV